MIAVETLLEIAKWVIPGLFSAGVVWGSFRARLSSLSHELRQMESILKQQTSTLGGALKAYDHKFETFERRMEHLELEIAQLKKLVTSNAQTVKDLTDFIKKRRLGQ